LGILTVPILMLVVFWLVLARLFGGWGQLKNILDRAAKASATSDEYRQHMRDTPDLLREIRDLLKSRGDISAL